MPLKILGLSAADGKNKLNAEWILVVNEGDAPFNTEGCSIAIGKSGARPRVVTTIQAGLVMQPKETCRLVTGSSGKKSHGDPPSEEKGVRNVHLFLKAPYLDKGGLIVRLMNKQLELCRATYDPTVPSGILPTTN
jgi:hypothetical protein